MTNLYKPSYAVDVAASRHLSLILYTFVIAGLYPPLLLMIAIYSIVAMLHEMYGIARVVCLPTKQYAIHTIHLDEMLSPIFFYCNVGYLARVIVMAAILIANIQNATTKSDATPALSSQVPIKSAELAPSGDNSVV